MTRYDWKGKRVLDYGIGGGYLGEVLFKEYEIASYVGVDISQKSLSAAAKTLSLQIDQGKVRLLLTPQDFNTLKPDVLISQAVIQHFPSVKYLDSFLANVNSAGACEVMLQVS